MYLNKLYVYAVDFSCFCFYFNCSTWCYDGAESLSLHSLSFAKIQKTNETENVSLHKVWWLHEKSKFEPENYVFYNGGTCMDKRRYTWKKK